jgi:hypothetical protein
MAKKTAVKRILNCLPSRETENDWTIESARNAGVLTAGAIPLKKDLREAWWTVGDQGATGSCVGWALADSVLRWHFVKSGQILKTEPLSPRFAWMAAKETDQFVTRPTTFIELDGTSLKAALDIARKFGMVKDRVLPFASGRLYQNEAQTFYVIAAQLKVVSYFNLGREPANWRAWLANHGPILTRLDVDATWDNAKATNGNLDEYRHGTGRGGHAVALVGYTPDRFIVRNSWGAAAWGDKGFGYASISYSKDAFTEAYGVSI